MAVTESIIKNIDKCVKENKLSIQEFFLEPIASAAAVLTDEQKEAGVCLIDIGGGTTDIAIYHGNIIRHSAVITLGGNIITNDIKQLCKLTEKQAEKLKIDHGYAMPFEELKGKNLKLTKPADNLLDKTEHSQTVNAHYLAEVINARVEEIAQCVDMQLEISGYKDKLSAGIILTGGGSLLKNISSVFMANLGIDTSVGIPNQHITTTIEELKSPVYSTAIGLLILGFQNLEMNEAQNQTEKKSSLENQQKEEKELAKKMDSNRKSLLNLVVNSINSIKSLFETPENLDDETK